MTAINFPDSPSLNDEFTASGRTWVYAGDAIWTVKTTEVPAHLDDLTDVTAPTPSPNDLLSWDGTAWINISPADADLTINPMTTAGDLIVGGTSGAPDRIAIGTSGKVLTSNGATATWETPTVGITTGKAIAMAIVFG